DIVAASGAFAGDFQPKVVVWPDATPGTRATERKFIDGGLVENLGVEGLWRYLTMARPEGMEPPLLPHLLIIVDASQRGRAQLVPYKMELTQLLARSQGISYAVFCLKKKRLDRPSVRLAHSNLPLLSASLLV